MQEAGENPKMQQLIKMLTNTAIGGLTKGDLEAERAKQLEAAQMLQEETKLIAQSQRKKINKFVEKTFSQHCLLAILMVILSPRGQDKCKGPGVRSLSPT